MNIEVGILYQYVVNSPERLLMVTKDENVLDEGVQKESIFRRWLSSYIIEKRHYTGNMQGTLKKLRTSRHGIC